MKTGLFFLFILMITLLPSCKTQCQILEEQISLCKSYLDCSNEKDFICSEVENAQSLIKTINSKITDGTDDKTDIEAACSFTISRISVGSCIDAQKEQHTNWQDEDIKYLMSNFGKQAAIDRINPTITINTNPKTEISKYPKCGEKITDEYKSSEVKKMNILISIMETFSTEVVPVMQINPESNHSNIFIGEKYITNEDSPCDFNKDNRFNINYKDYDYIFCSKSSGWLSETETTQSNCALARQEVFLINWKKDYFTKWCTQNCKNTASYCDDGNDYKCMYECDKICYDLREKLFCKNEYDICRQNCKNIIRKDCETNCNNDYISCKDSNESIKKSSNCKIRCQVNNCQNETNSNFFYECLENNKDNKYSCCNCENICNINCKNDINSSQCKECQNKCVSECINGNNVNIPDCYKLNLEKIENCYFNKIKENPDSNFRNCIENNEESCNESCEYDDCLYSCLNTNCNEYECFENSIDSDNTFNNKPCNNHSCYYDCQQQCDNLQISKEESIIMTVYREVEDEITGSNCDENEIFDNINYDYCVIEHEIFE